MNQLEGSVERIAIGLLDLDPANPRLPPEMLEPPRSQSEIARYIEKHYDPVRIAESISEHQFFESEPLIAVRAGSRFTVIEGNRRLTALKGLAEQTLHEEFVESNKRWSDLEMGSGPTAVPVLVVNDAREVAPLLGFRHISGIEPWDPYAQARYIALLVSRDGYSLTEVADLVGRSRTEVASKYRDFDVLAQADSWGISTRRARDSFGVFNNAMGRRAVRNYIGAPDPRTVDPEYFPLADEYKDNLATLLVLIFGDAKGAGKVISDSRQLTQLATVLSEPSGRALRVLLNTRDLQESIDAAADPDEQFIRAVRFASGRLVKAQELDPESVPQETIELLSHCAALAQELAAKYRDSAKS